MTNACHIRYVFTRGITASNPEPRGPIMCVGTHKQRTDCFGFFTSERRVTLREPVRYSSAVVPAAATFNLKLILPGSYW